ncbi:MAG: hypothetical protein HY646_11325 [Acidobacteria bacterium]|nr:hypothetical protein [Acidobacteriota bacterium]
MTNRESGFSLVESLTASAAMMVVMAATFTLLNMSFTAAAGITEVMSTQQNIRVALNTVARDIVMAGTGLPTGGISVPNGANALDITRPGVGGAMLTPDDTIAILAPANEAGAAINGVSTDALTITAMNQDSPEWTIADITPDGTEIEFNEDVQEGNFALEVGDVLVFTNSNGSVLGMVTSISGVENDYRAFFEVNDALSINQPDAEAGNIKALLNEDLTLPPTTGTRINIVTYYLNATIADHPRLMRVLNGNAPQVIAEDIENLQFSFDLFDYDTNVNTSNQETTNSPNQIRSVHVIINGRSSRILQRTQNYYRFSLASKVGVRNATFRNRYTEGS